MTREPSIIPTPHQKAGNKAPGRKQAGAQGKIEHIGYAVLEACQDKNRHTEHYGKVFARPVLDFGIAFNSQKHQHAAEYGQHEKLI